MRRMIASYRFRVACIDGMAAFAKEKPRTRGASARHPFSRRAGTLEMTQPALIASLYPTKETAKTGESPQPRAHEIESAGRSGPYRYGCPALIGSSASATAILKWPEQMSVPWEAKKPRTRG